MITLRTTGVEQVAKTLELIADEETQAALATARAALKVLRNAGVKASPGRVKLEWGTRVTKRGPDVVGMTGLGVGGYRAKVKRPHGRYLNDGTPYIAARHFVERAFEQARTRAMNAAKRVAKRKLQSIVDKKGR